MERESNGIYSHKKLTPALIITEILLKKYCGRFPPAILFQLFMQIPIQPRTINQLTTFIDLHAPRIQTRPEDRRVIAVAAASQQ